MARRPRLALSGLPHLVTLRGHGLGPLFIDDEDRLACVDILRENTRSGGLEIHAYSLQAHVIAVLVTPAQAAGLSLFVQDLGRRYVANFNRRHGLRGSLFDGRFRAAVVEPGPHALAVMRYVERDLGFAARSDLDTLWSSAAHHLGTQRVSWLVDVAAYWQLGNTPFEREQTYRGLLSEALAESVSNNLAAGLRSLGVIGSAKFVEECEHLTGRRLSIGRCGRPRTKK